MRDPMLLSDARGVVGGGGGGGMSFAGRGSGVGQAGGGVGQAGGGGGACVRVVCSDWATDGVHNDDCNELDESVGEARPECDEIGACIFWSEFEGAGGRVKELFRAECTGGRAKELCRSERAGGRAKELFGAECGGVMCESMLGRWGSVV